MAVSAFTHLQDRSRQSFLTPNVLCFTPQGRFTRSYSNNREAATVLFIDR